MHKFVAKSLKSASHRTCLLKHTFFYCQRILLMKYFGQIKCVKILVFLLLKNKIQHVYTSMIQSVQQILTKMKRSNV